MEYDGNEKITINGEERRCPYCNSLNIKEYLYGEPTSDYDREKYVLGGCEVSLNRPKYKCSNCGKDIYVGKSISNPNISNDNIEDNNEYIIINYRNNDCAYYFKLSKKKIINAGKEDYVSSICLEKIEYNNVYKIDGVQHLENRDFDKYCDKIMEITNSWAREFNNNELVDDMDTVKWSLIVKTKNNNLSFENNKVPNNMSDFKTIILELENLYKEEFENRKSYIDDKLDSIFNGIHQSQKELNTDKKGYLKREDFINSVNSEKIWSKSMTVSEVKELLDFLEKEITMYDYESDKNFVMDGRRDGLKTSIEERLSNSNNNINEKVLESLFNLWEFVNNEYYVTSFETLEKLHLNREEMEKMCAEYTRKGIICLEEKNSIIEMIQMIKRLINISNITNLIDKTPINNEIKVLKCPNCDGDLVYLEPNGNVLHCKACNKYFKNDNGTVGVETFSPYTRDDVLY